MFEQDMIKSSLEAGKRSSIFMQSSQEKRNLWWKAFRKTVLEPHAIAILENPMTDKVPTDVLNLVEEKCQSLGRHEKQALRFVDTIAQGRGFGATSHFPSDIMPPVAQAGLARSIEPIFDPQTLPSQEDSLRVPLFELPEPCPSLVSGFLEEAFSRDTFKEMPKYMTTLDMSGDWMSESPQPGRAVHIPFLYFERTYGHTRHELESAMNYCAMNGAAALNSVQMLFESAWPDRAPRPTRSPVVFSCIVDNDLGIINHHWVSEGAYFVAPLCKFDFRDLEHFMHFLAWIEAIEEWAKTYFLPDVERALRVLSELKAAGFAVGRGKALHSPVTDVEKQEKLSRSMKEAFDNIPWKGQRNRKTPLGVTGAMRMRSPKAEAEPEPLVTPMSLSHNIENDTKQVPSNPQMKDIVDGSAKDDDSAHSTQEIVTTDTSQTQCHMPAVPTLQPGLAFTEPATMITTQPESKRNRSNLGISLVESAGLVKSTTSAKDPRPVTSAGLEASKSPAASVRTLPLPRNDSGKSPGIVTSTIEMRSPGESVISVQSKRSFTSLRRPKLKSPNTPESSIGSSPKGSNFKSKIANSLGMIKEHTIQRPRRSDNSAPSSAKDHPPLPTPAYDKKRFDIRTPKPTLPELPVSSLASTIKDPEFTGQDHASNTNLAISTTAVEAYNASHQLPLRQWARTPTTTNTTTTTLTAGA
jgi:hypothetical protein